MPRIDFLHLAYKEALASEHIWPEMACAEAALESGFGSSLLAVSALNCFGCKQHKHPIYGTLSLPTKEYLGHEWKVENADWVKYPSLEACFNDRMETLKRLAPNYAHYKAALEAKDQFEYIKEVSKSWSTDPERASKVIQIHKLYFPALSPE